MGDIFENLLPFLRPKAHCMINVPDIWWENRRITIHVALVEELRRRGTATEYYYLGPHKPCKPDWYFWMAE